MLAGARWSTGAYLGDVNLVDDIELTGRMAGQKTGETGHEPSPDNHRDPVVPGLLVQIQQGPDLPQIIGGRHCRNSGVHGAAGQLDLGAGRGCDHGHGHIVGELTSSAGAGRFAQRVDDPCDPLMVGIAHFHHREAPAGAELARYP
jgi:hypothetical protein